MLEFGIEIHAWGVFHRQFNAHADKWESITTFNPAKSYWRRNLHWVVLF
jgi:hypothetical protein